MSKRTLTLILVLTAVTAFLLYTALVQNSNTKSVQNPPLSMSTQSTPQAQTSLFFSPNPLSVSTTQTNATSSAINLMVNTDTNAISGVQIELSYDPSKLTDVKVSPGSFLPNASVLLNKVDTVNGRIFYALVLPQKEKPNKGSGVVVTISFKPILTAGAQTQIRFLPKTLVIASGVDKSLLRKTSGADIVSR